ncbi:MAG: ABC transporter ATP-binding protein [Candidatus Nanopelagicales bacterium]
MASISVRNLTVRRGHNVVLSDFSVAIDAGRLTGLVGPSGGGKTTLIRSIVGVQRILSGEVMVLGEPAGSPSLRHRVGYVTQAPSVYGDLTVLENLEYFARVLGLDNSRIPFTIDSVDLNHRATARVASLSGGERSRCSLAIALLGQPPVLVLDEPTVGLDPVLRRDLWALFRRLADAGNTVLVSSHVMDEAERCDTLLLLRDGKLLANEEIPSLLTRTGTNNVEQAFLALIDGAAA